MTGRLIVYYISQRDDAFINNSHSAVSTVDIEIKIEFLPAILYSIPKLIQP